MSEPPTVNPINYASHDVQSVVDAGHLRALAICHYVWGGLIIALSSIFIIYIVMGIVFMSAGAPPARPGEPPPEFFGMIFVGIGTCGVLLGWAAGVLNILCGRGISTHRWRVLTLVMAGINCLSIPFGTLLGVFTFIILSRPSVKMMYDQPTNR
jgi:hypothetical protein